MAKRHTPTDPIELQQLNKSKAKTEPIGKAALAVALEWARRRQPVFPCNDDKSPLTENGFYDATMDEDQIRLWWTAHPRALVAGPTGHLFEVLDIDVKTHGLSSLPDDVLKKAKVVVRTRSGGYHLLYLPDRDVDLRNWVGRLPGVDVRTRGGYVILAGSPGWEFDPKRGDLSLLTPWPDIVIKLLFNGSSRRQLKKRRPQTKDDYSPKEYEMLKLTAEKWFQTLVDELSVAQDGTRNHRFNIGAFQTGAYVRLELLHYDEVEDRMLTAATACGSDDHKTKMTIKRGLDAGILAAYVPAEHQVIITVQTGQEPKALDAIEQALIDVDDPIYLHGEALKRPSVILLKDHNGKVVKFPGLVSMSSESITEHLAPYIGLEYFTDKGPRPLSLIERFRLMGMMRGRADHSKSPRLSGIITTPTLRPDGSLLTAPGYDPETQLLLYNPPPMPEIPAHPTREDAERALATLNTLLAEFPFNDEDSRAVALSALITPVVRGIMDTAPMHLIVAPAPDTGKSFLMNLASLIATGEKCPAFSFSYKLEENEKILTTALLSGQSLIAFDNVNGTLPSFPRLCQAVSEPIISLRPLGTSDGAKVRNSYTFFVNGINTDVNEDMTRRVLRCALDANEEDPGKRVFKGDPEKAVLDARGLYIAAALTIPRAYILAGRPNPITPTFSSFATWSRVLREALVWLGCGDPGKTTDNVKDESKHTSQLSDVLLAWWRSSEHGPLATKELIGLATKNAALFEAIENVKDGKLKKDDGTTIDPAALGNWLHSKRANIASGLKLVKCESQHKTHVAQYELKQVGKLPEEQDHNEKASKEQSDAATPDEY